MEIWDEEDAIRHEVCELFSKIKEKEFKGCSLLHTIKSNINTLLIPLQVYYPEAFKFCIKIMKEEIERSQ